MDRCALVMFISDIILPSRECIGGDCGLMLRLSLVVCRIVRLSCSRSMCIGLSIDVMAVAIFPISSSLSMLGCGIVLVAFQELWGVFDYGAD